MKGQGTVLGVLKNVPTKFERDWERGKGLTRTKVLTDKMACGRSCMIDFGK